jgi:hypothetical protein
MHSAVQKTSESKQQSQGKTLPPQDKKQDDTFSIEDNRPETAMRFKLMEGAEQSTRVHQLSAYQRMADNQTIPSPQKHQTGTASKLGGILQRKEDSNGLPAELKAGVESLSGQSMSDVIVHRNSDKPAQLQAHAYAQGTDIHLAPGQEQHLPHEAWHVAQQKQGRVEPTTQLKAATLINDDQGLEEEADMMGAKAMQMGSQKEAPLQAKSWGNASTPLNPTIQRKKLNLGAGKIQGFGTAIKNLFGKTTFTKLTEEVNKFNALPEDQQGEQGKIVKALGQKWLDSHSNSEDPNDVEKKNAILQIMDDLKGDSFQEAKDKGIFKDEKQASDLEITEYSIEQANEKEKEKGFINESGKISDKKGWISTTSFMSDAESTVQGIVEKTDQNLGAIDINEKLIRGDAAMHAYFTKERESASTQEQREGVTKHAKGVYSGKFVKNILIDGLYQDKKGQQINKKEVGLPEVKKYKDQSFNSAQLIKGLNNEADDDLATIVSYAQQIQALAKEERNAKTKDENEVAVQEKRKEVAELIEDSKITELKVDAEKRKSEQLVNPLRKDGRLAGTFVVGVDNIRTAIVSKVSQMVTMGLVSAKAKYKTGGVASSEGFDLKEDNGTGELTSEVVHGGSQKGSRFKFEGPKAVMENMVADVKEIKTAAAKFKGVQPITGFFVFSGALKQFESGIGYIRQIVGTIQTWSNLIGTAFPVSLPITGAISAICQAIATVIGLITKASKTARFIFSSLVKMMNQDPELWGLVQENFAKSGADGLAMGIGTGIETAYAAGEGAALKGDATAGVKGSFNDQIETDPAKIAASAGKVKSNEEIAFGGGKTVLGLGTDKASDKAGEVLIGDQVKEDKKGKVRPRVATKAVQATIDGGLPLGNVIVDKTTEMVQEASKPSISDPQILTAAIDEDTNKLKTESTNSEAISQKIEEATTKKEETAVASSVSSGIQEVGKEIVQSGIVATRVAEINASIKRAKELEALRATQRGGGKK